MRRSREAKFHYIDPRRRRRRGSGTTLCPGQGGCRFWIVAPIRLAVVVPTRNRADLAIRAVASVLAQKTPEIEILVSDNSTSPADRAHLRSALSPSAVPILSPPTDLAMTDHWNWAIDQAQERIDPTHITFLTDRMVFKRDVLPLLLRCVAERPASVVSYNHDGIADASRPVYVDLEPASWRLHRVTSQWLLDAVANGQPWQWMTPRMLNSVTPTALLDSLRSLTGNVFGSVAPDFYFGYRIAALVDEFFTFDASLLVHYALSLSNGYSQQTGTSSPDAEDFKRRLVGHRKESPYPTIHTISNAIFHEYGVVARETCSPKFRPLSPTVVARRLRNDVDAMLMSADDRREVLKILPQEASHGGGTAPPSLFSPARIRRAAKGRYIHIARRATRPIPAEWLPDAILKRPRLLPYLSFRSTNAALEAAICVKNDRRGARGLERAIRKPAECS